MRLNLIALGALVAVGIATPAQAQDVATAEALFRRGLDAMAVGHYPDACAALAESLRIDPRPGTLFTVAECRAKEGRIATAVALYEDYLSAFARLPPAQQSRQRQREKTASARKQELGVHVPRLVLRLPTGVTASVIRDDVTLHAPALGIPLPVDPGAHEITTQADGGVVQRQTITIGLDEEKVVELEVLPPKATEAPKAAEPMAPVETPPPPRQSSHRPFVYAALGLGVTGLVVGAATGALVLAKKGAVAEGCVDHLCTPDGLDAVASARTFGAISTTGFVIGGLGVAAAGVLYFTDRRAPPPTRGGLSWRPTIGSVNATGAWLGARGEW